MGIFSRKSRGEKAPKIVIKGMPKEVLDRLYGKDYAYVQLERAGGPLEKMGLPRFDRHVHYAA